MKRKSPHRCGTRMAAMAAVLLFWGVMGDHDLWANQAKEGASPTSQSRDSQECDDEASLPPIKKEMMTPEAVAIYDYFLSTEYAPVAHVIVAMTVLETGWHKSEFHKERHNYFSTKKRPSGDMCIRGDEAECYTEHRTLRSNCRYALNGVFRKRGYRTDEQGFYEDLVRYRYAEDSKYVRKVKKIVDMILDEEI